MAIVDSIREALGFGDGADTARGAGAERGTDGDGDHYGTGPAPLDHFRAGDDAPVAAGVYRVVGRSDDAVTLLRVAEDGRRVNTGAVVHVPRSDLDAFEPADDPDTGLGRLRQAPETLAERPLYAGLAFLLMAFGAHEVGVVGDLDGLVAVAGGVVLLWMLLR